MKACGFFGPSGAGKTPLMGGVLRELKAAGQRVWLINRAHEGFAAVYPEAPFVRALCGACARALASTLRPVFELRDAPGVAALLLKSADRFETPHA